MYMHVPSPKEGAKKGQEAASTDQEKAAEKEAEEAQACQEK
jgi:hypothetical protein